MVLNLTKKWNEWKKNLQKRSYNEPLHIMVTRKQGTCKGYGIFFFGGGNYWFGEYIKFMETNVETKCCKFTERPNIYIHIS